MTRYAVAAFCGLSVRIWQPVLSFRASAEVQSKIAVVISFSSRKRMNCCSVGSVCRRRKAPPVRLAAYPVKQKAFFRFAAHWRRCGARFAACSEGGGTFLPDPGYSRGNRWIRCRNNPYGSARYQPDDLPHTPLPRARPCGRTRVFPARHCRRYGWLRADRPSLHRRQKALPARRRRFASVLIPPSDVCGAGASSIHSRERSIPTSRYRFI